MQKRLKQGFFWPQMRPEDNIEAEIEAGRVNLAKNTHKAKEAVFDLYRGHGPSCLQQTPTKFWVLKIALDLAALD